ncbi:MAG: hypothetical protein ABFS38_06155 [Bacteroidota bacterium]
MGTLPLDEVMYETLKHKVPSGTLMDIICEAPSSAKCFILMFGAFRGVARWDLKEDRCWWTRL